LGFGFRIGRTSEMNRRLGACVFENADRLGGWDGHGVMLKHNLRGCLGPGTTLRQLRMASAELRPRDSLQLPVVVQEIPADCGSGSGQMKKANSGAEGWIEGVGGRWYDVAVDGVRCLVRGRGRDGRAIADWLAEGLRLIGAVNVAWA
jgi:hypothetical protein